MAPAELGVDERDDVLNVVNLGELLIEPGGRIIVQGNLLIFGCQHLRQQPEQAGGYQLGVLPTPYPVDRRSGPLHGAPGAGVPGGAGGRGRAGGATKTAEITIGRLTGSLTILAAGGRGGDGGDDGDGGDGGDPAAELRTIGGLIPAGRTGHGGRGGDGGHGGHGG